MGRCTDSCQAAGWEPHKETKQLVHGTKSLAKGWQEAVCPRTQPVHPGVGCPCWEKAAFFTNLPPTDPLTHGPCPRWGLLLGEGRGDAFFLFISRAHPLLPMKVSSMCKAMACSWQRRAGVGCIFVVIYTKELLNLGLRTVKLATSFNCLQFFSTLFFYLGVCSQDLLRLEI